MWVDEILQPIAQNQDTYFPNSFALKKIMVQIKVPPNASLFTYDVIAMYPRIPTERCKQ